MLTEIIKFSVAVVASDSQGFILYFYESAFYRFFCVGDAGGVAAVDDADEFFWGLYFGFFDDIVVSYDVDGCIR